MMATLRRDRHELSGVYALDAIPDAERDQFERHRGRCRSCDDEIRGLAETATSLGFAAATPPPAGLRARVLASASVTRQLPPLTERPAAERSAAERSAAERPAAGHRAPRAARGPRPALRSPWVPRLAVAAAVVCLAAAVTFGSLAVSAQHRLDAAQSRSQAIAAVLAAPDARIASQATSHGGTTTAVISPSRHTMVVTTTGLPALPASKVYELWLLGPGGTRPAGLLPRASAGLTAPVLASGLQTGDKVAMTVESAGGTSRPTTPAIVVMSLPA